MKIVLCSVHIGHSTRTNFWSIFHTTIDLIVLLLVATAVICSKKSKLVGQVKTDRKELGKVFLAGRHAKGNVD